MSSDVSSFKESTMKNNNDNNDAQTVLPKSRIPEIWQNFHRRLQQIDKLENSLDEHVKRFRRRITCALDQTPSYRRSHLRFFVAHKYDEKDMKTGSNPNGLWTLVVEGKLLIGLLDHASAQQVDKHGAYYRPGETGKDGEQVEEIKSSSVLPAVPEPGAAEANEGQGTTRAERAKYRR